MSVKVYGIESCDKIRKLFALFDEHEIEYQFVDLRKNPPTEEQITAWEEFAGDMPINRRGTTYKSFKKKFDSATRPEQVKMMLQSVACFERPIIERDGEVIAVGGRPERLLFELF